MHKNNETDEEYSDIHRKDAIYKMNIEVYNIRKM